MAEKGRIVWRYLDGGNIVLGVSHSGRVSDLRLEMTQFLLAFPDARSGIGQVVYVDLDEKKNPLRVSPSARWAKVDGFELGKDTPYTIERGHVMETHEEAGKVYLWVCTASNEVVTLKLDASDFHKGFPNGRGAAPGATVFMKKVNGIFAEVSPRARWAQVNKEPEAPDTSTYFT